MRYEQARIMAVCSIKPVFLFRSHDLGDLVYYI